MFCEVRLSGQVEPWCAHIVGCVRVAQVEPWCVLWGASEWRRLSHGVLIGVRLGGAG